MAIAAAVITRPRVTDPYHLSRMSTRSLSRPQPGDDVTGAIEEGRGDGRIQRETLAPDLDRPPCLIERPVPLDPNPPARHVPLVAAVEDTHLRRNPSTLRKKLDRIVWNPSAVSVTPGMTHRIVKP